MKKLICLILALTVLLTLSGCTQQEQKIDLPAKFYYCRAEMEFGTENGVIDAEIREIAHHSGDLVAILSDYLAGPADPDAFTATFPSSTYVVELLVQDKIAFITVSDSLAQLTGIDLTVACACITMTVIDLTDVSRVRIGAKTELLDGSSTITMNRNGLLTYDNDTTESEP